MYIHVICRHALKPNNKASANLKYLPVTWARSGCAARKTGVWAPWYAVLQNTQRTGVTSPPRNEDPTGRWRPMFVLHTPGFTLFTVTLVSGNNHVSFTFSVVTIMQYSKTINKFLMQYNFFCKLIF